MSTYSAQPLAFADLTVIDTAGSGPKPGMTVVIEGHRITRVGLLKETEVPPGSEVVDGRGTYLIPRLWDMHAHTSSDRITREILIPLFTARGPTGIRDIHADCFEEGRGTCSPVESSIIEAQGSERDVEEGTLHRSRFVASSTYASGPGPDGVSAVQGASTPAPSSGSNGSAARTSSRSPT